MKRWIYWHDPDEKENVQRDLKSIIEKLNSNGLSIEANQIITSETPVLEIFGKSIMYDVLLFDWGGISSVGNSMLSHFCEYILDEAEENPSKIYIMVSRLTSYAMKDVMSQIGKDDIPANVFLTINDAAPYLKMGLK